MRINFNNLLNLVLPRNRQIPCVSQTKTSTISNTEEPRNYSSAQLSAAVLANVSYKNNPQDTEQVLKRFIKNNQKKFYYLPDDFYSKFDYKNADVHMKHLKYLIDTDSDMGFGSAFSNGYFYSKDGAEAFDILMKNYSAKRPGNFRDAFSIMLGYDYKQILSGKNRNLFDDKLKNTKDKDFKIIENLIKLSDDEFERLKSSGLIEQGIYYASKNDDINKMFISINQDKSTSWEQYNYKYADKLISDLNNDNKIKEITEKFSNIQNKEILKDLISEAVEDKKNIDIEFFANHLDELYTDIHSNIKDFDDDDFYHKMYKVLYLINNDNYESTKSLIKLDGMNQHLLASVLDYMYNKENSMHVKHIIDEINAGNEDLIALPVYKYAQINPRVADTKNNVLPEYDNTVPLSKLEAETKLGDIFAHGNNVYIKDENNLERLDLDKDTYKKLFPEYKSLCIQQGEGTGNCYFLSGGLISFWKNPKGRVHLLKTIKQDGNDIVVTIPGLKKYPVRFKDGNIKLLEKHSKTSLGNLMLEQAYAKAKYAKNKNIKTDVSDIDADKAMEFIYGGFESHVFNELTGTKNGMEFVEKSYSDSSEKPDRYKLIKNDDMSKVFDKYSDLDKYIVCVSSGIREDGYLPEYGVHPKHAYAVENIDTKNKTVTIINPYNSLYTSTISYEQASKYLSTISVIEIK
jgi:hypothetical protein